MRLLLGLALWVDTCLLPGFGERLVCPTTGHAGDELYLLPSLSEEADSCPHALSFLFAPGRLCSLQICPAGSSGSSLQRQVSSLTCREQFSLCSTADLATYELVHLLYITTLPED